MATAPHARYITPASPVVVEQINRLNDKADRLDNLARGGVHGLLGFHRLRRDAQLLDARVGAVVVAELGACGHGGVSGRKTESRKRMLGRAPVDTRPQNLWIKFRTTPATGSPEGISPVATALH